MTTRRAIARPLTVVAIAIVALLCSGITYSATHWIWLGLVNLILLVVGAGALIWTGAVAAALTLGALTGKARR